MKTCNRVGCHNEVEDNKDFCNECLQDGMDNYRRPICRRNGCIELSVEGNSLCTAHLAEHLQETNPFIKNDTDKVRMELLDPDYMVGVAQVLTFGAIKYNAYNWQKADAEGIERIKGAMLRHQMAYMNGETIDKDSGLNHMYHVGCNAMFLAYFDRHKDENAKQGTLDL